MAKGWIALGLSGAMLAGAASAAQAPPPPPPPAGPPDWSAAKSHIDRAASLGGTQWGPTVTFLCGTAQTANGANDPVIEPVKLFDNLYALGDEGTVIYAITTPQGVILLDAGYANKVETVIVPGLRRLGIDPDQVKMVLVAHGHADHYGGAAYFQQRGAKVAVSAADWPAVEATPLPAGSAPLKRDLVLEDQKPITFGGVTVTPVAIPGHTPGSMGFIVPVADGGKPHVMGMFGSAALILGRLSTMQIEQVVDSTRHFGQVARTMKVDVELQNHPKFDDMWNRLAQLKTRRAGDPNPFVVGVDGYRRFNAVMTECYQSQLSRKGVATNSK